MGHAIHRKGRRFRIWSTFVDQYITGPMCRRALVEYLTIQSPDTIEARIDRAVRRGTSSLLGPRDATQWDLELKLCGTHHHLFSERRDGRCGRCGRVKTDAIHRPCERCAYLSAPWWVMNMLRGRFRWAALRRALYCDKRHIAIVHDGRKLVRVEMPSDVAYAD